MTWACLRSFSIVEERKKAKALSIFHRRLGKAAFGKKKPLDTAFLTHARSKIANIRYMMDNDLSNGIRQWSPQTMRQYPLPVLHPRVFLTNKHRERQAKAHSLLARRHPAPALQQDIRVKSEKMLAGSCWLTSIANNELRIESLLISCGSYMRWGNIQRIMK